MGMTAAEYLLQLQALLPTGSAWPRDADAGLTLTLESLAEELARIDARADDLVEEADPRTTSELLPEWERVAALPSPCVTEAQSVDQRRAALVAKLILLGGQSPDFFIDLAAGLGLTITIKEGRPLRAGKSKAGDPCYSALGRFIWHIHHPDVVVSHLHAGSKAGDPVNKITVPSGLGCLGLYAPAHTIVYFSNGTRRI